MSTADTTLEPAAVLRLIQDLLPEVASTGLGRSCGLPDASDAGLHVNIEASREEAGEILWDLSTEEANAQLMVVRTVGMLGLSPPLQPDS